MPVTIVVGGQFGSEGKGKVTALLSHHRPTACVVRCGGPNSGHTTIVGSREGPLRQIPSSVNVSDAIVAIVAGAVIDEEILAAEIAETKVNRSRIIVDPRAVLVSDEDKLQERTLRETIASTGSGNGRALSRRLLRENVTFAGDSKRIQQIATVQPVAPIVHEMLRQDEHVIVEGTQGFGLSLLHGPYYPHVTAKDTTASTFAMEVGISPRDVTDIIMVIRTFPIRVGGDSGPLPNEITWEEVQQIAGAPECEPEYTSVTKHLRRVATFDLSLVKTAFEYNKPTALAVMGLDRLDHRNRGLSSAARLTSNATKFLKMVESELGVPIDWVGTGFGTYDAIRSRNEYVSEVCHAS